MLEITPNPFNDPLKKILDELKRTKWEIPFILPLLHAIISVILLLLLGILYITLGFISQVSNSFWDVVLGYGQKMSFSSPLPSLYYSISASVFFLIFLPFFILQSPFWLSGWITSKIGFKPFLIILLLSITIIAFVHFKPDLAEAALTNISDIGQSLKSEIFPSDTINIQIEQSAVINLSE